MVLSLDNAAPAPLSNERRAPFENETIPDSLDIAWDIDAGSGMRASLLVADSAVFVATTNRQLLAFGTRNGKKYWDQRMEGEMPGDIARSGRSLFMATSEWNGRVHARDMERGRAVWRHNVGPTTHGPLVEGGIVYIGTDHGEVYALRSESGEQLWKARVSGSVASVPLSDGDAIIVGTTTDTLYRIARSNGAVVVRAKIEGTVSAAPALQNGTLILPTFSGFVVGVRARDLQTQWHVDTGAPVLAAPIAASNGVVHALNRNAEIWRIENGHGARVAALGGGSVASFTLARDRYIVGKLDGTLVTTDLSGRVVAQHKFNDSIVAPVVVAGGALYVPFRHGRIVKMR